MTSARTATRYAATSTCRSRWSYARTMGIVNRLNYPQSPVTHWRVSVPTPSATTARALEVSLYRLLRFQRTPFSHPRPVRTIRILPLHTLVRMPNQAARHHFGNLRLSELLL